MIKTAFSIITLSKPNKTISKLIHEVRKYVDDMVLPETYFEKCNITKSIYIRFTLNPHTPISIILYKGRKNYGKYH